MPSHAVRLCGSCVTCEEMRDSLIVPSRRRRMTANVRAERLLKIPAEPSPELRIPGAAAQTRVVSMVGIRLGSWESARAFKGIICDDVSEFESYMPSQAVGSLYAIQVSTNRFGYRHFLEHAAPAVVEPARW